MKQRLIKVFTNMPNSAHTIEQDINNYLLESSSTLVDIKHSMSYTENGYIKDHVIILIMEMPERKYSAPSYSD